MRVRSGLLFDTQAIIVWAKGTPPKLVGARVNAGQRVCISIVSFWEHLLKSKYHNIGLSFSQMEQVADALEAEILDVKLRHLTTLRSLPFVGSHKDPFDRLIISQAITDGLTLVGSDTWFPQYQNLEAGKSLEVLWR